MRRAIPLALAALALAACQPAPDNPDLDADRFGTLEDGSDNPSVRGSGTRYDCDTGATVFAERRGATMLISLADGRNLALPRVDATGGGTRYAESGWVWFATGDRAVLTEQGGQANCRVASGLPDANLGAAPLPEAI